MASSAAMSSRIVRALQRVQALGGDAQRVAERQSDALPAQIQRENSPVPCILLEFHALSKL